MEIDRNPTQSSILLYKFIVNAFCTVSELSSHLVSRDYFCACAFRRYPLSLTLAPSRVSRGRSAIGY